MRDTAIIMSSRVLSLSRHEIRARLLNVNKYYFTYNTCVSLFASQFFLYGHYYCYKSHDVGFVRSSMTYKAERLQRPRIQRRTVCPGVHEISVMATKAAAIVNSWVQDYARRITIKSL